MGTANHYYIHDAHIVNENKIFQGDVVVQEGKISRILGRNTPVEELTLHPETRYVDASGLYLLPGGIDEHVHFREPGLTHKGGFESESRAAVAGDAQHRSTNHHTCPLGGQTGIRCWQNALQLRILHWRHQP